MPGLLTIWKKPPFEPVAGWIVPALCALTSALLIWVAAAGDRHPAHGVPRSGSGTAAGGK